MHVCTCRSGKANASWYFLALATHVWLTQKAFTWVFVCVVIELLALEVFIAVEAGVGVEDVDHDDPNRGGVEGETAEAEMVEVDGISPLVLLASPPCVPRFNNGCAACNACRRHLTSLK